jgi:hypothetical protein
MRHQDIPYASQFFCFVALPESAKRDNEIEDDGELEDLESDEDDDWDKEIGDDDEDGDEVDSKRLQKLAAQVSITHSHNVVPNFKRYDI